MTISKRIICVLLSLALLLTWPGFSKADAELASAVIAGTALVSAAVLIPTVIGQLGFQPGTSSATFDNLVSSVTDKLSTLGYIADGMIQVGRYGPSTDAEQFKAALAQDFVGVIASQVKDSTSLVANDPSEVVQSSVTFGGHTMILSSASPISSFCYSKYSSSRKDYTVYRCYISSSKISYSGYGSVPSSFKVDGYYILFRGDSETFTANPGFPILLWYSLESDEAKALLNLFSGFSDGYTTDDDLDVSAVPSNFTDIPSAYPSWVASGASYNGATYLPVGIYVPGTGAEVLPTEVPDVTEATQPSPSEDPDDDKTNIAPLPPDQFNFFGDAFEKVETGLERIGDRLQQLQDGILPQIDLITGALTQGFIDVGNWFASLGNSLLDGLKSLGADLSAGLKSLYDTLHKFATQTFPQWVADAKAWALALPGTLTNAFKQALSDAFVPSPGYMDDKIDSLKSQFPFFFSVLATGDFLKAFLAGLGQKPPIIYIDLTNNSWSMGGKIPFIDLTWYAQYKPTMDTVLSAFLWLLFLWRLFLLLPTIVDGLPGSPGSSTLAPEPKALPPGHETLFYGPPSNTDQRRLK